VNVIEKIKKLLQLADTKRNSNIEEATAAAAKAQKLMEKHRIHRAMLEDEAQVNSNSLIDQGKPENWKLFLVSVLAKHNGCYVIQSENYYKDNKINLAGISLDAKNVQCLYTYFVSELNRLCLAELIAFRNAFGTSPIPAFVNSFYIGAITIIDRRLEEANLLARSYELQRAILPDNKASLMNALQKIDTRVENSKEWVKTNLQVNIKRVDVANSNVQGYDAGRKAAEQLNFRPDTPKLGKI
jgi:hypothetical protein